MVKQLRRTRQFLHIYLDALFDRDHHLGFEFHDLQVELYAEYDYPKLLEFLRASHYISLEKVRVSLCFVCDEGINCTKNNLFSEQTRHLKCVKRRIWYLKWCLFWVEWEIIKRL